MYIISMLNEQSIVQYVYKVVTFHFLNNSGWSFLYWPSNNCKWFINGMYKKEL